MLGRPAVHPMLTTSHLQMCWDHISIDCPWVQDHNVVCHDKKTLNFWAVWSAEPANKILIFNRGDPTYTVFVALPFSRLVELFAQSYATDATLPGLGPSEQPSLWAP
jgi:hypothetical protein